MFELEVSALIVTWESGMILYKIDRMNSVIFPVGLCVLKYLYFFIFLCLLLCNIFIFHYIGTCECSARIYKCRMEIKLQ